MSRGEWVRPHDPMVDSDAPDQIAHDLGRRHSLYLREAQRHVVERRVPDAAGLADGIRAETRRYLASHPWLAGDGLRSAVEAAESESLSALGSIVAGARAAGAPPPPQPPRRLALQPAATVVGNLPLRKRRTAEGVALEWSRAASVVEWVVRVGARPDPRADYVEVARVTLAGDATTFEVTLDDVPRRVQVLGNARGGRTVQRATISALTRGNSGAQWRRQAGGA